MVQKPFIYKLFYFRVVMPLRHLFIVRFINLLVPKLAILNTREIQKIRELLRKEFGFALEEEYAWLKSDKDKIFVVAKDITMINLAQLNIDKIGLYFGEMNNNRLRLSKEGAQLLAREARQKKKVLKNVVTLTKEEVKHYFRGNDLEKDLGPENRLMLLRYENNILGCAQYKEKRIINFLPKIHRGEVII